MKRLEFPLITMYLSPVERKSVQGRSDYAFIDSNGNIIAMKRSFAKEASKRYMFPSSIDGTRVVTGLDRPVDNKWFNLDISEVMVGPKWESKMEEIVKKPSITKQLELEIRFDLPQGTLTDKKNLHHSLKLRDKDAKPNFLESFYVVLYDRPNRFTDDTLRGALTVEMAKVSGKIATSKAVVNPSKHDFYVSEENEAAIERAAKQEIINNAITDLTLLRRNHTEFMRYKVAVILDLVKGIVSEVVVRDEYNKFITDTSAKQLENIEKFNNITATLNDGTRGLDKLQVMYVLKQAVNSNAMSISSGEYLWHSKKGVQNLYNLGSRYDKILKLFMDEFEKYTINSEQDNLYGDLVAELKTRGIRIDE
jgi:hypothetical protein